MHKNIINRKVSYTVSFYNLHFDNSFLSQQSILLLIKLLQSLLLSVRPICTRLFLTTSWQKAGQVVMIRKLFWSVDDDKQILLL